MINKSVLVGIWGVSWWCGRKGVRRGRWKRDCRKNCKIPLTFGLFSVTFSPMPPGRVGEAHHPPPFPLKGGRERNWGWRLMARGHVRARKSEARMRQKNKERKGRKKKKKKSRNKIKEVERDQSAGSGSKDDENQSKCRNNWSRDRMK